MKKFTYQDYKKALKGAGPKLAENILQRAANDPNITFEQHKKLAIGALRYKKFLGKGFKTIRGTAATGLLPENTIRRMVADGTCPGVTVGNRFMVNVELLAELLEEKSINNERIW